MLESIINSQLFSILVLINFWREILKKVWFFVGRFKLKSKHKINKYKWSKATCFLITFWFYSINTILGIYLWWLTIYANEISIRHILRAFRTAFLSGSKCKRVITASIRYSVMVRSHYWSKGNFLGEAEIHGALKLIFFEEIKRNKYWNRCEP